MAWKGAGVPGVVPGLQRKILGDGVRVPGAPAHGERGLFGEGFPAGDRGGEGRSTEISQDDDRGDHDDREDERQEGEREPFLDARTPEGCQQVPVPLAPFPSELEVLLVDVIPLLERRDEERDGEDVDGHGRGEDGPGENGLQAEVTGPGGVLQQVDRDRRQDESREEDVENDRHDAFWICDRRDPRREERGAELEHGQQGDGGNDAGDEEEGYDRAPGGIEEGNRQQGRDQGSGDAREQGDDEPRRTSRAYPDSTRWRWRLGRLVPVNDAPSSLLTSVAKMNPDNQQQFCRSGRFTPPAGSADSPAPRFEDRCPDVPRWRGRSVGTGCLRGVGLLER